MKKWKIGVLSMLALISLVGCGVKQQEKNAQQADVKEKFLTSWEKFSEASSQKIEVSFPKVNVSCAMYGTDQTFSLDNMKFEGNSYYDKKKKEGTVKGNYSFMNQTAPFDCSFSENQGFFLSTDYYAKIMEQFLNSDSFLEKAKEAAIKAYGPEHEQEIRAHEQELTENMKEGMKNCINFMNQQVTGKYVQLTEVSKFSKAENEKKATTFLSVMKKTVDAKNVHVSGDEIRYSPNDSELISLMKGMFKGIGEKKIQESMEEFLKYIKEAKVDFVLNEKKKTIELNVAMKIKKEKNSFDFTVKMKSSPSGKKLPVSFPTQDKIITLEELFASTQNYGGNDTEDDE